MPKGQKFGGRQKGVPNKNVSVLRENINTLVQSALTPEFLERLTDERRADLVVKLLPYVLPKFADIPNEQGEGGNMPQIIIKWG